MGEEILLPQKGRTAVHAGKGTLSCVDAQMALTAETATECARAQAALVATLSCVAAHVLLQVAFPSGCVRTEVALEGALARVCAQMSRHVPPILGLVRAQPAEMQSAVHGHERLVLLQGPQRRGTCNVNEST